MPWTNRRLRRELRPAAPCHRRSRNDLAQRSIGESPARLDGSLSGPRARNGDHHRNQLRRQPSQQCRPRCRRRRPRPKCGRSNSPTSPASHPHRPPGDRPNSTVAARGGAARDRPPNMVSACPSSASSSMCATRPRRSWAPCSTSRSVGRKSGRTSPRACIECMRLVTEPLT